MLIPEPAFPNPKVVYDSSMLLQQQYNIVLFIFLLYGGKKCPACQGDATLFDFCASTLPEAPDGRFAEGQKGGKEAEDPRLLENFEIHHSIF